MDFVRDVIKFELVFLLLLITGTAMAQVLHPTGVTSSDIQPTDVRGVEGKCQLKDIVTVFVKSDASGCSNSNNNGADNLYHYMIIVENRCKYCNAKGIDIEVSGYFLGDEIVNLKRPFAPGGDQYVVTYSNWNEVGGVSPAHATFYECGTRDICYCSSPLWPGDGQE